jgi:gamma-glutamyltranspeptidase / glutathione hydrolase
MIASVNMLASSAGLAVLRQGGNAVDAAVAAGAVLTVTEPWSGQLGGDGFLLVRSGETGQVTAINGSGAAPAGARLEAFAARGGIPETGWWASTVPGLVDAWRVALERFGSRPLAELLEPAVAYAEDGFPLTARQCRSIQEMAAVVAESPETAAIFLPGGSAPQPGYRLRQPALARTLRRLQAAGPDDFYRGEIAAALVSASDNGGGLFTAQDLSDHRTVVLEALRATYRGWTVYEQPPVSQGIVVLLALMILEHFDLPRLAPASAETIHLQVEAHKLALADRLGHLGDPRFEQVPTASLLSATHARLQAQRLDRRRAAGLAPLPAEPPDTTYLCTVDRARTIVSYIHSLYGGSGVVAGDTGILLNNRMAGFSLDPNSPNRLDPGKRPIHTLNSWMLFQDEQPRAVGGTPGAYWQIQTNLQLISQLIDFQAGAQAAVDAPRWTMGPQTDWSDTSLNLEARVGAEVLTELQQRGHAARMMGAWAAGGAAQLVTLETDGTLCGAGDPRPGTSAVLGL